MVAKEVFVSVTILTLYLSKKGSIKLSAAEARAGAGAERNIFSSITLLKMWERDGAEEVRKDR
jgi:hypothetical protein